MNAFILSRMVVLPIILYFLVFKTSEGSQCGYSPSVEKFKPIFYPETAQGLRNRILGGDDAEEGEWPWVASLQGKLKVSDPFQHICTSSILNERWILTAAHCCNAIPPSQLDLYIVSTGSIDKTKGKMSGIENYVMHASWKDGADDRFMYDLCLMKVKEDMVFDKNTQPICIQKNPELDDHEVFITAGWGERFNYLKQPKQEETLLHPTDDNVVKDFPTILQQGMMTQKYNETYPKNPNYIQLINRNSGTGSGDSGGPLMALRGDKWTQVGVVSGGGQWIPPNKRIDVDNFEIYTKTFVYCDWIEEKTGGEIKCE